MLARVKKLYKNWKADRQQLRELTNLLDNLTDMASWIGQQNYETLSRLIR